MDVEKFVDGWTRKYHGNKGSLVDLVQAALAQDREEREKLPRWHCPSCGADTPMNDFDWSDTLSADLERLAELIPNGRIEWPPGTGIVVLRPGKTGAEYYWAGLDFCGKGVGFTNFEAAVAAALQEIDSLPPTEKGTQP